ncbi:hypothetical protein SR882_07800 [Guyparkeria halophila]|uniref:Uncharacterized protein n=1 Tax=Guyparkeria halophila TaxID=47960 RepID=A0ABZ0YUI1_9GAMM|nr:hypothetical protein [Guyparkeria halophila]WQH15666.1 hypothetical protein SR882_07800 [Guyparkeria halophila]
MDRESKLGVVVRDAENGERVPNMLVSSMAEDEKGNLVNLGVLASNANGFLAFDLVPTKAIGPLKHLWVQPLDDAEARIDVVADAQYGRGGDVVTLGVPKASGAIGASGYDAPQSVMPSVFDFRHSPGAFGGNADLSLGEDDCRQVIPSNKATKSYFLREVIRDVPWEESPEGRGHWVKSEAGVRTGKVREYRVTWSPARHTLGEVVYSVPLAPCEAVNLAVIDWSRSDDASRGENTTVTENLRHRQRRDRSIEETVEASVREIQGGGSLMSAAAATIPIEAVEVNAAAGSGLSFSGGRRQTSAETTQELADTIVQSSASVRSRNSTIVTQSDQSESEVIETRTVRNHNNCHALTVLYHEVLRNYLVRTEFNREVEVLLVEQDLIDFTPDNLPRYRHILEPALQAPRLRECFDANARLVHGMHEVDAPEPDADSSGAIGTVERFKVRLYTGDEGAWVGTVFAIVSLANGGDKEHKLTAQGSDYGSNSSKTYDFPVMGQGVRIEDVREVGVRYNKSVGDDWKFKGVQVEYLLEGESELRPLYRNLGVNKMFSADGEWRDDVSLATEPDEEEGSSDADEATATAQRRDRFCQQRLLDHLNAQQYHYSRLIWLNQSNTARTAALDAQAYGQGTLLDYVVDRPLAVQGRYLAYPLREVSERASESASDSVAERVVSLPARGVFAEAQLSSCSVCEKRDVSRRKDWSQSPCRDAEAPEISGVSPGSRARDPDLEPTSMPDSVVNIVNPQPAPDPTGMAGALGLLGQSNIFRDMSGRQELADLMTGLATGSVGADEAQQRAREIMQNGGGGASDGSSAGQGSTSKSLGDPARTYDDLQLIEEAYDRGALTDEGRQSATSNRLGDTSQSGVMFASHIQTEPVDVRLRLFIPSEAVDLPGAPPLGGDGRGFSYDGGTHRAMVECVLGLDPDLASPIIGSYRREFGESTAYAEEDAVEVSGKPSWFMAIKPGATPTERATQSVTDAHIAARAQRFEDNPLYSSRVTDSPSPTIKLNIVINAAIPDEVFWPAPEITGDMDLYLTADALQKKTLYRLRGQHDGFPAYELYLNGQLAYAHDPVATGHTPASLFGSGEIDPDHGWREVPMRPSGPTTTPI